VIVVDIPILDPWLCGVLTWLHDQDDGEGKDEDEDGGDEAVLYNHNTNTCRLQGVREGLLNRNGAQVNSLRTVVLSQSQGTEYVAWHRMSSSGWHAR